MQITESDVRATDAAHLRHRAGTTRTGRIMVEAGAMALTKRERERADRRTLIAGTETSDQDLGIVDPKGMDHHVISGRTAMVKDVAKVSRIYFVGTTLKVNTHLKVAINLNVNINLRARLQVNTGLKVDINHRAHLKVNRHHKVNIRIKQQIRALGTKVKVRAKVATQVSKDLMWGQQRRSQDVFLVVGQDVIQTFICRTHHHVDLPEVVVRMGKLVIIQGNTPR